MSLAEELRSTVEVVQSAVRRRSLPRSVQSIADLHASESLPLRRRRATGSRSRSCRDSTATLSTWRGSPPAVRSSSSSIAADGAPTATWRCAPSRAGCPISTTSAPRLSRSPRNSPRRPARRRSETTSAFPWLSTATTRSRAVSASSSRSPIPCVHSNARSVSIWKRITARARTNCRWRRPMSWMQTVPCAGRSWRPTSPPGRARRRAGGTRASRPTGPEITGPGRTGWTEFPAWESVGETDFRRALLFPGLQSFQPGRSPPQ